MESNNTLDYKQQYLHTEIIDAGYEPEQFQDFLEQQGGLDLDSWNIAHLIIAVKKFKGQIIEKQELNSYISRDQSPVKQQTKIEEKQQSGSQKQIAMTQLIPAAVKRQSSQKQGKYISRLIEDNSSSFNNTSLLHFYTCKPKLQTQLWRVIKKQKTQNHTLSITIPTTHESHSKLIIFKFPFIQYEIHTKSSIFQWKTQRRFNQFQWLHDCLNQIYPNLPIPPIPEKTHVRSFDKNHIDERKKYFQRFLNKIVQCPQLASEKIVQSFLKQQNNFQEDKRIYDELRNKKANKKLKELQSVYGQDQLNPNKLTITDQERQFYNKTQTIYDKISKKARQAEINLMLYSQNLIELQTIFQEASQHQRSLPFNGVYQLYQLLLQQMKQQLRTSKKILTSYIRDYYDYESKFISVIKKQIDSSRLKYNSFITKQKDIFKKSEDVDISALSSNQQTDNKSSDKYMRSYQFSKQQYKISFSNLLKQLERYEKYGLRLQYSQLMKAQKILMKGIKQSMIKMADLQTKAMSFSQGKKLVQVQYIVAKK